MSQPVGLLALGLTAALAAGACGEESASPSSSATASPSSSAAACTAAPSGGDNFNAKVTLQSLPDGLRYGDISVGTGAQPAQGRSLTVQYTGWLTSGCQFDTSRGGGRQPFSFTEGQHLVIKGWEEGVATMRVGGKRRLVIPPDLGYGPQGYPPAIPANATLVFDIELLSVG